MKGETTITVPSHYMYLSEKIKPILVKLNFSLLDHPRPHGNVLSKKEVKSLEGQVEQAINRLESALMDIAEALQQPDCMCLADYELRHAIDSATSVYRAIWERPFPPNMAGEQLRLSSAINKSLNNQRDFLKKFIYICERPDSAVTLYGSCNLEISPDFSISQAFDVYPRQKAINPVTISGGAPAAKPAKDNLGVYLLGLLGAFLVGRWTAD